MGGGGGGCLGHPGEDNKRTQKRKRQATYCAPASARTMPRMKLSTRTLSIILAAIIALAIFVAISAVGNSIKQTEREVRAKHETAEKIRAARGY